MKLKQNGFVTIECIISMTIISIGMYVISSCMYNSYNFINISKEKLEMLNVAKREIEKYKYDIKYSENHIIEENNYNSQNKKYNVKTTVQEEQYYQCYKVGVEVYNTNNKVNLDGYVYKQ